MCFVIEVDFWMVDVVGVVDWLEEDDVDYVVFVEFICEYG